MNTPLPFAALKQTPFSRRGSFLSFYTAKTEDDIFGRTNLFLGDTRLTAGSDGHAQDFRGLKLSLADSDGTILPSAVTTTTEELILTSPQGDIRFCIGERGFIRAYGESGLSLKLTPKTAQMNSTVKDLADGSWLVGIGAGTALIVPLTGTLDVKYHYDFKDCIADVFDVIMRPDDAGVLELGFEEFFSDPAPRPRDAYPTYEQCVSSARTDFELFERRFAAPALTPPYEARRRQAMWTLWTLTDSPEEFSILRRDVIRRMGSLYENAYSELLPLYAMLLSESRELAADLFAAPFDHAAVTGQLPAFFNMSGADYTTVPPPYHGLAALYLIKNGALTDLPRETLRGMYDGLSAWASFLLKYRDPNGDGLIESFHPEETGYRGGAIFACGLPTAFPSVNAEAALLFEAVSQLGELCGADSAETSGWAEKSRGLTNLLVGELWDGERWLSKNASTGEKYACHSVEALVPVILGDRLPEAVLSRTLDALTAPGELLTPYGLASESLTSPYFGAGEANGLVSAQTQTLFILGLELAGYGDIARDIAAKFARTLRRGGLFNAFSGVTGTPALFGDTGSEVKQLWSSLSAAAFVYLTTRYGDQGEGESL